MALVSPLELSVGADTLANFLWHSGPFQCARPKASLTIRPTAFEFGIVRLLEKIRKAIEYTHRGPASK